MGYDMTGDGIERAIEEFFEKEGIDSTVGDEVFTCFYDFLCDKAFDFDLVNDPDEAIASLPRLYAEWEDTLLTMEDIIELGEQCDMEPDAIEGFIATAWDFHPPFPFVFTSPVSDERWLCVDWKPVVSDLLAWADFDSFRELEAGYVKRREEEYLVIIDDTAIPYDQWLADPANKETVFSWLSFDRDFDLDSDRFCFPGNKTQYSYDEPPIEPFLAMAKNSNLDAGDMIEVVRVPHREDVIEAMGRQMVITNCFMDFPYVVSFSVLSLLEPETVRDLDDLLAIVAIEMLDSPASLLIDDAMTAPDPAEYVAAQVAFALQTHSVIVRPLITVEDIAEFAWDKISAHLPRFKRRASAKKRERARSFAGSVFDAVMGR